MIGADYSGLNLGAPNNLVVQRPTTVCVRYAPKPKKH